MIEFRQKEFGRVDKLNDLSSFDIITRGPLEIMKAIEMMDYDGVDIFHWVGEKFVSTGFKTFAGVNRTLQLSLSLAIEDNYTTLNRFLGTNLVNDFIDKFKDWDGFIEKTKSKLLTETKNGEPKYARWFNNNQIKYSNKEYKNIYKFIALALSGQIEFDIYSDYWNNFKVNQYKVDYSKINPLFMKETDRWKNANFIMVNILSSICFVPLSYGSIITYVFKMKKNRRWSFRDHWTKGSNPKKLEYFRNKSGCRIVSETDDKGVTRVYVINDRIGIYYVYSGFPDDKVVSCCLEELSAAMSIIKNKVARRYFLRTIRELPMHDNLCIKDFLNKSGDRVDWEKVKEYEKKYYPESWK
jgi:hypothetical protein